MAERERREEEDARREKEGGRRKDGGERREEREGRRNERGGRRKEGGEIKEEGGGRKEEGGERGEKREETAFGRATQLLMHSFAHTLHWLWAGRGERRFLSLGLCLINPVIYPEKLVYAQWWQQFSIRDLRQQSS